MNEKQARIFGRWLASKRLGRGLSARELGVIVGIDDSTINRIENGSVLSPDTEKLLRIGRTLGLDDYDVLKRAGLALVQPELPALPAYLRVKYRHLPPPARDELEAYLARLSRRYGLDPSGPAPGEDEAPWPDEQAA